MTKSEIKKQFSKLIKDSNNIELIEYFYIAFLHSAEDKWEMSEQEKNVVLEAFEESKKENNLICAEEMKIKHLKWITK